MKNGETVTFFCGPSSSRRNGSFSGLPMRNEPPGIAFMANETVVPGIVSVKSSKAVTVAGSVNGSPFSSVLGMPCIRAC